MTLSANVTCVSSLESDIKYSLAIIKTIFLLLGNRFGSTRAEQALILCDYANFGYFLNYLIYFRIFGWKVYIMI